MTNSPLITSQGLVVHQYNEVDRLGQQLPSSAGSAEAQLHFITGTLRAYTVTNDPTAKRMCELALTALMRILFRGTQVPNGPITPTNSFSPNVYAAAKSPMRAAVIHYNVQAQFVNGVGYIWLPTADIVHRVFSAKSLDAVLAIPNNPYSPLISGTSYAVTGYQYDVGIGVKVTLATAYNGPLILLFSTKNGAVIDMGQTFDAWPDWAPMGVGQIVTSGDLYLAAFDAFVAAYQVFGSPVWSLAAARIREQMAWAANYLSQSNPGLPYSPAIVPYMSTFAGSPLTMTGYRGPALMGMQTPSVFQSLGSVDNATKGVALLTASQVAWPALSGQPNVGPFVPYYHLQNEGIISYGAAGTFNWSGPDYRTAWGGYQYRPMVDLLTMAATMTIGNATRSAAINVSRNLLKWLAQDLIWLPMWAPWSDVFAKALERSVAFDWKPVSTAHTDQFAGYVNKATALDYLIDDAELPMLDTDLRWKYPLFAIPNGYPDRPPLGPPTDFPQGAAQINNPDPQLASIIMRAVTQLDTLERPLGNGSRVMTIELRALMSKSMALLDRMWVTEGEMAGTFSPDAANREWYGVWHGEILEGLVATYIWSSRANIARPSIAAKTLSWIQGMLAWAADHNSSEPDPQHFAWIFAPNWRSPIIESFEYSTTVFTAFTGAEQRLSLRVEPRRQLSMMHSLAGDNARNYDATLHAKQNQLLSVPQWHLSIRVTEAVPLGQTYLLIDELPTGRFTVGDYIAIAQGGDIQFAVIAGIIPAAKQINLTLGVSIALLPNAKVLPTDTALLDAQQSSTRRTSTVLEAQATMMIVPQEDRRQLPIIPAAMMFTVGADSREVILRKPNRRDALNAGHTWTYASTKDYASGPVRVINGEDKGRRTMSATWSLLSVADVNDYLGLIRRLHGKRYAAWLPSWTDDFKMTQNSSFADRIYVRTNFHIELGELSDPTIGLFIAMKNGTNYATRVSQVIDNFGDMQLRFDRTLAAPIVMEDVAMISLMYRVRQMNDTASLRWLTDEVAETTVSFISVFDEP